LGSAGVLVAGTGPLPELFTSGAGFSDVDAALAQAVLDDGLTGDGLPQLARLSVDSGGTALAVAEVLQEAEAREQVLVDLQTDPADYGVADDRSIVIQAAET